MNNGLMGTEDGKGSEKKGNTDTNETEIQKRQIMVVKFKIKIHSFF